MVAGSECHVSAASCWRPLTRPVEAKTAARAVARPTRRPQCLLAGDEPRAADLGRVEFAFALDNKDPE